MLRVEALKQRLSCLDAEVLDGLHGLGRFEPLGLSADQLSALLCLAERLEDLDRRHLRAPLLPAELAALIECREDPSARWAWVGAATRLGMAPLVLDASALRPSPVVAGALAGMNAHALALSAPLGAEGQALVEDLAAGVSDYLRTSFEGRALPVVELGPATLALGDVLFLREALGELEGKRLVLAAAAGEAGAAEAEARAALFARCGLEVTRGHDPAALEGAHAVLWRHETPLTSEAFGPSADALLLHDLAAPPAGVAQELLVRFQGAIARQANKRTYALMAALAAAKVRNLWLRLQELLD